MKGKRILLSIAVVILLCTCLTGCLTIFGNILNGIDAMFQFVESFGEDVLPENTVYGSNNDLAVGFRDGELVAFWDTYTEATDTLTVTLSDGVGTIYDSDDVEDGDLFGEGCFYLERIGIDYADTFDLTLKRTDSNNIYEKYDYRYDGITKSDYNLYTRNVPGGFSTIDSYLATRYELFEYFSYLIIFRPNSRTVAKGGEEYELVEKDFYVGYDYLDLYGYGATEESAFESEVMSAVASFEDSAAYTYSYEVEGNRGKFILKFYYDEDPYLISDSYKIYRNVTGSEKAHYNDNAPLSRSFPIDLRAESVTVSSSDQLYFAIKKGYKPNPVAGSNADLLYKKMREILTVINDDEDNDPKKIHHVYDYIIDTVVYDYDFTENILEQETDDDSIFFSYNCLYLEGVFGLRNGTFYDGTNGADERVAICDGLSKAFLCMTQIEGIESLKISGKASGGAHAWNKVKVNNRWYMVDTTWGNNLQSTTGRETLSHDYLMVPDQPATHEEDGWFYYPKATGRYNFLFS